MWGIVAVLVAIVFILLTCIFVHSQFYWQKLNVPHTKSWPPSGLMFQYMFRQIPMVEAMNLMYKQAPKARYHAVYHLTTPILLLRDPELIKQILVKDFDTFMNHINLLNEDIDPLFGKNLISLTDQRWRDMRATLSPSFTGSKMRIMYNLINEAAEQFCQYFVQESKKEGVVTVEMKDVLTRYANDVIATTAFGIKCDSLRDRENEFYVMGKQSTTFGLLATIKGIGYILVPSFMKKFKISMFDQRLGSFFHKIIDTSIEMREKEGIVRPDMIHLLMEARKLASVDDAHKFANGLTNEDITAQAAIFFFAGYDTVSTVMSFMAYELAVNPDIQKRLQDEIDNAIKETDGKLTYEQLIGMKYLDMVVSESLRKWPPAVITDRVCGAPYTIKKKYDDENDIILEKDLKLWIPIYGLHHDPKYFPNPERFDPERFSEENKNDIVPFTYNPFGIGPRICIASRFALLEVKTLFANLLSSFDITVVEKTQIPVKISKKTFSLVSENGIWIGLKPREQK